MYNRGRPRYLSGNDVAPMAQGRLPLTGDAEAGARVAGARRPGRESQLTAKWSGTNASRFGAPCRALVRWALWWVSMAAPALAQPAPECVGDCSGAGRVTAADVALMSLIAGGAREVSACPAGDASGDGQITVDEIEQALRNIFACGEPTSYARLTAEFYQVAYPTDLVTLQQAAGIVSALEHAGEMNEAELRAFLPPLLSDLG